MPTAIAQIFCVIANINWLDVIKTLAPVATTFIAFLALRNWKRQDRAKREVEFLDELIETTHSYVVEIGKPVQLLRFAKIGMASHVNSWEDGEETDKATRGAIAYIEKRGEEDGKRLSAVLGEVRPTVIKLRSLGAKGQVFKFEGYAKCQQAIALLTWHFDRIEAFMFVVASPTWNWQNPEVHKNLTTVMTIEPDDIHGSLKENNVAVIDFVRSTYQKIYG